MKLTKLERRIIDLSYKNKVSHIGSCLSAVETIERIYSLRKSNEPFILSSAHASIALYAVLEKYEKQDAQKLFDKHGVHCNRDIDHGIWASGGSLGHGLGIAVGMALANRDRLVWCVISDGECAEGSVWEALRIASENRLENLRIECVANSYGAYSKIDVEWLKMRLQIFYPVLVSKVNLYKYPDWLQGQQAHYTVMDKKQYEEITG